MSETLLSVASRLAALSNEARVTTSSFDALLLPMTAHVMWVAVLYVLLTLARAPRVWGVGRQYKLADTLTALEPRIGANLGNQFEWPLIFYIACLLHLMIESTVVPASVLLAWIFVGGRIIHSGVQIFTTNIRLRGLIFTINFAAVLGLWLLLVERYVFIG